MKWYKLRWQVVVLTLLAAGIVFYGIRGRYWHPTRRGSAGPSVSLTPFNKPWSGDKIMLMGFGDSITEGFGASKGHGYFDLLIKNDDKVYPDMKGKELSVVFPDLTYKNLSVSYTTSSDHLRDLSGLRKYPQDVFVVIVLTTGGNDLIHPYGTRPPSDGELYGCSFSQGKIWSENYRRRLNKILDGITERFPGGCEIFLANIYDPTDGVGDIENANIRLPKWEDGVKVLGLFNKIISETANQRKNVRLVDIHEVFLGHGIHCRDKKNKYYHQDNPYYWYYVNLEDPNDQGYDAIRRVFLIEMIKVFYE